MGCLGFLLELIVDGIIEGWMELMQLCIPRRMRSRKLRVFLKILAYLFSILLFMSMLLGVFALLSRDPEVQSVGKTMVFLPLGISAVQIGLGLLIRAIGKDKEA